MKKRQASPEHQELENEPGLANQASDSSSRLSKAKQPPSKKGRVLQDSRSRSKSKERKMEDRKVLFDIIVEVEDGREVHVQMREGDSAEEVATKFCEEQNLPNQLVLPLTEHIINNIVMLSKQEKDVTLCFGCRHHNVDYGQQLLDELENKKRMLRRDCKDTHRKAKRSKEKKFTKPRKMSERLLSRTLSSARKIAPQPPSKTRVVHELSDRERALVMRLQGYREASKRKREEERKQYMETYKKNIQRAKPAFSKKSRRIMQVRQLAAKQFQNYGELLYWEALSSMQARKKLVELGQEEKMKAELEGVTWKPKISKMAHSLKRRAGEVWERLQSEKRNEARLQALRKQLAARELMECTFKPLVSTRTPGIEEVSLGSVTRFDLLFWDAESRRQRQHRYTLWYPEGLTFRPCINKHDEEESPPAGCSRETVNCREGVFTRLLAYAARLTKKRQKVIEESRVTEDPVTGHKLFTPLTGRSPRTRNKNGLSITEFLYRLRPLRESRKQSLEAKYFQEWKAVARLHRALPGSEKLGRRFEERTLRQLFDYLDEDKDGYVDLKMADEKPLTGEVVQTIAQAAKDPEATKPVAFEKFLDIMLRAQTKKRNGLHLVLSKWRKDSFQKLAFKLRINKRSRDLAVRKRNISSHEEWYALILSDQKKFQQKIGAMRKQLEEKESSQCPFRPKILPGVSESLFRVPEKVHVEESGEDDVHGYIFKETHVVTGTGKSV